jgi:hypothetical protein
MDIVAGKYPLFFEEWALDGQPSQPYRQTISRRDILATGVQLTQATLYVFAVVCQPGDIIGAVNLGVKTATATPTHGWAALYTGVGATATLITQATDDTSGFHGSGASQKFTLATPYLVGGFPGTPQGAGQAASGLSGGPVVLGLALYNSGATGATLDGMTGSSVAGGVIVTGQVPMASSVALAATATAPATLAGITAATIGVPYAVLSRS